MTVQDFNVGDSYFTDKLNNCQDKDLVINEYGQELMIAKSIIHLETQDRDAFFVMDGYNAIRGPIWKCVYNQ